MKKRTIRFICLLLALLMIGSLAMPYLARANSTLDKLQQELNGIRDNLNNIKDETERQEANKASLQRQNKIILSQIGELEKGIQTAQETLAQKQLELDQKRRDIQETDDLFQQRLRAMYVMHNSGALSTLLGVNSFEELLTASTTLSRISVSDTELLKKLAAERAQMEADERYIQDRIAELETQLSQQESKKNELAANIQAANSSLTELDAKQEAEEQAYAAKLAEYNAARAQAEAEMGQSSGGEFVGGSFGWPVPGFYNISSPYGWRTLYGKPDFHTGIDIAKSGQIFGATVVSSLPGTVQTVRYGSTGYGYYVIVDHGGGYKTLYGHLSAIYVTPGQAVAQGTPVGAVGSTGNSTGPHLHFEIRAAGQKVDPMQYLKG